MDEEARRRRGVCPLLAGHPGRASRTTSAPKGTLTTCASKILYNFKPPYNATVVEKLAAHDVVVHRQGAIWTNLRWAPRAENSATLPDAQPTSTLTRVPGGSSGGSAAVGRRRRGLAVARVRIPAARSASPRPSAASSASSRPTAAVSRYGLIAFASSLDQIGPFARSCRGRGDAARRGHRP